MAQSGPGQMIKPDAIDRLPFLDDEKKKQYRNGLASLWHTYNTNAEGSNERNAAEQKIRNASQKLMSELANSTRGRQGQVQQQQQQQRPPTQASMNVQASNGQGSMNVQAGNGQAQQQQQQQQAGNAGQAQLPTLSAQAQADIRAVQVVLPHTVAPEQEAKYRSQWLQQAINIMRARDGWIAKGKQVHQQLVQFNTNSQPVPPQLQAMLDEAKKGVNEATGKWNALKADNERKRQAKMAAQGQQGQPQPQQNMNKPQAPEMQRSNTAGSTNGVQQQQQQQPPVKTEARASNSPSQPQGGFQQQQQQQQQQPNTSQPAPAAQPTPNMPQQAPQQQQQQQQQHPQQVQRTPQSATQPQQNYAQQQYQNQQQRQMHPQLPQQQNMQHSQPQPQQSMPNAPQRPQVPHALSHGDAVAQAQAHYAQQQQQQPPNQPQSNVPQLPNGGIPFNSNAAQQQQQQQPTPTSAYPSQAAPNLHNAPNPNNKFPIQKQMQIDPRLNQPIQGPPSRPTMNAAGMQNQPGLSRPPPYTLEGEGDHVLSKRKLDELVRQVTGGTSISSTTNPTTTNKSSTEPSTTPTASFLDPAVEENILHLADDFVDDLITSACRLAKLRPDRMLDIKDIQIVLERNYGIRVPGYTLEEARTVRKFVPAPGWQGKMQAIGTAKTLGGVGGGGGKGEV
ncbi:Transcription initiation factor TFIID subunit 12 [Recurvomyces mirabilis]|uniref:Transcription initiation factor TFIID subunit 12 n=1 Tax=Recurvomyces mirabilis TaxID=574656 RepID=A0AAE0WH05_9PEZI|nr:Transcription initiation factor TFIID subunit 12 [Recurvomyces mirabilis]KAK5149684.1 Transcription initiation factor TFIID subunit 12 [Recurvomyces mirabilis]